MKVLESRNVRRKKQEAESVTDRQERITGWRQERIAQGRVLVLGAGALGNEVAKNLALMGLGYMLVADMDQVSVSNLSRAVFFRENDARQHRYKAEIIAKRAQAMNVNAHALVQPFHGDIVWQLGGGIFRRVDVVLGCLDNVEARMAANLNCLLAGTPFIDGGILGLSGAVTAVHPPTTACWECTTYAAEREHARDRYHSCSQVMRRDIEAGRLPTVQVASSIIAGFQTQEAVKVIQGQPWAAGYMIQYDATAGRPDLDVVQISRRPGCWCSKAKAIEEVVELPLMASGNTLGELLAALQERGYEQPSITLPGSFVATRTCMNCRHRELVMRPEFQLDTTVYTCSFCGALAENITLQRVERIQPEDFERLEEGDEVRDRMMASLLSDLGFPSLALVSFSTGEGVAAAKYVAELSDDAATVMGGEQYTTIRTGRNQ